jgi:hypothetical protein
MFAMLLVGASAASAHAVVYEGYTPKSEAGQTAVMSARDEARETEGQAVVFEGYTPKADVSAVATREMGRITSGV